MAGIAAVARILFNMGRDEILPKKFFGKLHNKLKTPVNNIILVSIVAASALFYSDNVFGAASLISFGAISGFILVNISLFTFFYIKRKERGPAAVLRYVVMPGIGLIVCIVLFISIEVSAKILGFSWLAIGIVYLAIMTKGFRVKPKEMRLDESEGEAVIATEEAREEREE
jgi:amino acid transporter